MNQENSGILEKFQHQVEPFWQTKVSKGTFSTQKDFSLAYAYAVHPQAKGAIAISSGRIETLLKYKEVVYDLYQLGYSVFIHDHRGQGLSARLTDNPQQGYVASFSDYVSDFKTFYHSIIAPNVNTKPALLCHSMGSAIGALYLLTYPDDFVGGIFTAPMFGIRPAMPKWLGNVLVRSHLAMARLISPAPRYFFGQGDYQAVEFADNVLTHSEARYQVFREEYIRYPEVQLGGVTSHWLKAAIIAMDEIELRAPELRLPILHLQAELDLVVENKRQSRVCKQLPSCTSEVIQGGYHELLMETDDIRNLCFELIEGFLQQHLCRPS